MATTEKKKSVFETLNAINVNDHTEKKNGLTYLSWAWAWAEAKKCYPNAAYTVYESQNGCNYFTDGKTCWVKTGVTIEELEHIEYLPVMDYKNKSIPLNNVTSFDVNKAIQRSLTKALARHGLGLYIYAGEDLPEDESEAQVGPEIPINPVPVKKTAKQTAQQKKEPVQKDSTEIICSRCGQPITSHGKYSPAQIAEASMKQYRKIMCFDCAHATKVEQEEQKRMAVDEQIGLPFPIED